ncbi:uncharacterized protein LOC144633073 isoform X2 [Oculina patagonica]
MASASESTAKAELKKEVVEVLSACEGHCLNIGHFKPEYKKKFGKNFDKYYKYLRTGKKLKTLMAELGDVIDLYHDESGVVMKLKEPDSSHAMNNLTSPDKTGSSNADVGFQQVKLDSKLSLKTPISPTKDKESSLGASADVSSTNPKDASSNVSDRAFLKARRRVKKSNEVKKTNDEPTEESTSTLAGPAELPASPSPSTLTFMGASLLPLSPPPVPRLEASGFGHGTQMTPLQMTEAITSSAKLNARTVSLLEIMEQQAQEEKLASESLPSPNVGYGRLLQEMDTPKAARGNVSSVSSSPVELKDARVRQVGTPGPLENSINFAYRQMVSVTPNAKSTRNISFQEVNRAAEEIITSMAEEGRFVSLEVVKAKLCKEFGKLSLSALGFRRDKDIPALNDLIQLQAKVSLFVHAYVMSSSIATLYELNQSLADLGSKPDFEDLKLGPLLQQPVVYDMFKAPPGLPALPHITTIQILRHLEKYMTKEDLWRQKVDLKHFMEYLCEEYKCETPYELGVRIQSIGLAISVIKKAKHGESEKWKAVREQVTIDMDEEIQRHLRKIKKDLLGQELGDLRSCVMRFLDTSPVDSLKAVFNCCLEMFAGKHQKQITKFFTMVTGDLLGRRLFQLACYMSCKRLLGDALQELVDTQVEMQAANNETQRKETEARPVPPSEGVIVQEVKKWLTNADNVDLARLALIEGNIVNKFPGFNSFDEFGYGSFLRFLTKHKELLEAIEQVGGMARSGRVGTTLGHQVSLNNVLDFISQCGTQTSPAIERNLCSYYGVSKVTDLGFGSCSNLLKKATEQKKNVARISTPSVVYEAALLHQDTGTNDSESVRLAAHNSGVLGYKSKEEAVEAIRSVPLLEDVSLWTHWDEVFGGDVSKLGDLKSFLENERILMSAGKSSLESQSPLVVMETSPGVLLRVTTDTSPEMFKECACRGDAIGTAGHLVSMVIVNGGVANTPVALLANHMQSCLASMAADHDIDDSDYRSAFVLECLTRMPHRLAQAIATKVFLEPLKKLVGSSEAPSLLLSSCSTQSQRSHLHQLGFALGISQWIEDFQNRVSFGKQEDMELHFGLYSDGEHKRPVAVVRPVASSNKGTSQESEISLNEPEDDATNLQFEDSVTVKDGEEVVTSDTKDKLPTQSTSAAPSTEQQEECRAVIEQIRREDFGIGLELGEEESKLVQRQREREGRGLHRLSTELYTRDTHFVLELVQNADDNTYPEECSGAGFPSLVFVLERDKIMVLNNEVGFEEKNIRALCDVGRSTKGAHRYGYIGQKGIGFKSVFRVSDCPEVHSNGYHIRFDAKSGPIGYILPQWIGGRYPDEERSEHEDDVDEDMEEGDVCEVASHVRGEFDSWPTRIVLPLKEEHQGIQKSSLSARFRDVHPSLLLFLHRLRGIFIHDQVNNSRREMVRKDLGDNIMEVSHSKGTDRWLVIKKELDASNMKEDVEMTELALAFPLFGDLNNDTSLGKRHQTLPQQNVFAYLPLRSYGFRFIIQGDFEVPSSREDVDSDKSWNQWLREEIPQLFIDALSVFMDHSSFSGLAALASYFQFVPLEEEILDFFTPVARHILKLLQGKPCIPVKKASEATQQATDGDNTLNDYEWVLPCKAVFCEDRTIQELVTPALLEEHLGLSYLHPEMVAALNPTLRSRLGIETLSSKHLIEIGKAEAKRASTELSTAAFQSDERRPDVGRISWVARWLQCMYRCLEQERNSSQEMLDLIGSLSVIPLTDGSFVNLMGDSVFLPLSMKKISEGAAPKKKKGAKSQEQTFSTVLEKDLSTVHPALFSSLDDIGRSQVEQLLRRLGVKSWSARELINSHIIPTFKSHKWKAKSKEVLRSYLVYILEERLTDPSLCDMNELRSCVQILTNKGIRNPIATPIHFTPKYGNTIDLARQLPSISWTLIDESYLDSCSASKARPTDWKDFLTELGVQHFLAIKRKQVKLHRNSLAQSPWATYEPIWQTTPDGFYIVDDWACEEFEEFLDKIVASNVKQRISPEESKVLAQCIDELWEIKYAQFADGPVQVKDTNNHVLAETRSSFYLNLVSKPWMAASTGGTNLFLPRDLFVWSDLVYQLLEDHVKFVAADLKSNAFISTLRIRESVNVDGMISEMKQWSASCSEAIDGSQPLEFTTSVAHMGTVYSFLFEKMSQNEEDRRKINDAFHKNALIFVPRRHPESSSQQHQLAQKTSGSFLLKKDVCWRDPTDVAVKLFVENGKVTTRRLLERHYSSPKSQQSLAAFFIDQLHVDETPNVDEYIEMASTVAEVAGFPSPSSSNDMLKIFATLGNKCVARGHNDSIRVEKQIDENMAAFLKQSLERELKCIFPSFGKWVALTDKPLLPDDKSLLKIFQKEKSVHFLDFGDFFQPQKQRSSMRKLQHDREEMQHNVSLFLETCEVKSLSKCITKEFTPNLVQYQCVPLQKYFHQLIPSVQRFLHSRNPTVYDELKRQGFAQKLLQMQFASVQSLETVYSLSTHPEVRIPTKEKSGVQAVGSTYCCYVVQEYQENADVLNAEMVKLLLGGKKQGASDLSNFLVAVKNYNGNDLEFFLEEVQGLDPLPVGEEPWSVPPPEEPDIEVEEEATSEAVPLHADLRNSSKPGDGSLHSWPPKSAAQYDKTRQREGESSSESTLKMWPPPAPPDSVKKPPEDDNRHHLAQGRQTQRDINTERPIVHEERPREKNETVLARDHPVEALPLQHHVPTAVKTTPEATVVNTSDKNDPESPLVGGTTDSLPTEDESSRHNTSHVGPQSPQTPGPSEHCIVTNPGQTSPTRSYLWFNGGTAEVDFEDLPFNCDTRILDRIPLADNPNREDIGRWGEQCVFEFLQNQAKCVPPDVQVEIIWVNEGGNTTTPYDIEIRRHLKGVGGDENRTTLSTYIEVKTTSSDQKEIFELSVPELRFAITQQEAFHLYRVFNAGKPKSVRILRLQNLASNLERKTVKLCMVI